MTREETWMDHVRSIMSIHVDLDSCDYVPAIFMANAEVVA